MSFLAGAFLAGLAALGIPLLLHRMSMKEAAERDVSSLMLMRETDEPIRTRRALAHKILLAIRLAALAAITLAFAEPVLEMTGLGDPEARDRVRLVVVDGSLSMRRAGAWEQAVEIANGLVEGADESHVAVGAERLTLVQDIRSATPGFTRFDFEGLPTRLDALIATLPGRRDWEIHLVSDFQASAVPSRFNALVEGTRWPTVLHRVGEATDNWAIKSAAVQGDQLEAVVAGHGETTGIAVALRLDGIETARSRVAPLADSEAIARFDVSKPGPDGASKGRGGLFEVAVDTGDAIAEDDVFRLVRPAHDALTVAVVPGGDGDASARTFLDAALKANGVAEPVHVESAEDWPRSVDAAIIVDPGEIPAPLLRRLERYLNDGGGALLVAGPRLRRAASLPFGDEMVIGNIVGGIRGVVAVDSEHPLAQTSFQGVEVQRSLSLPAAPGETILALVPADSSGVRSESDAPLLVEKHYGKGRLVVLLTALDREWSSLVLRPAFVGFVRDAIDYLSQNLPLAARAGQGVSIPAGSVQIFDSDGRRVLSLNNTVTRPVVRIPRPGFYTVRTPGREATMAVNVDPLESDLRSVPNEFLQRWQAAIDAATSAGPQIRAISQSDEADKHLHPLAPWLLGFAAILLLLESTAANVGRIDQAWLGYWRKGATA
ncbi:MAG: BatA domain-containing protein [Gammaproteobacteria bacterium]|nr:BatA domain-containing protein [Gammaproteobacteria bacterium]